VKGQSIAAKPLRISGFGKFSNAGDVSFEPRNGSCLSGHRLK